MMGEQHDHEHQHSDACCHDHSDGGHSHAASSKGSGDHQDTEQQKTGSEGEGESDEEEDDEEDDGQADLVFPATYSLALAQLLGASSAPVSVKDIKLDGGGDQARPGCDAMEGGHCCCLASIK